MISRRDFLKTTLLVSTLLTSQAINATEVTVTKINKKDKKEIRQKKVLELSRSSSKTYLLKMYNPNTLEILVSRIPRNGKINKVEKKKINYFLRDFHSGKVKDIDNKLIISMCRLLESTKRGRYIVVHSAYRTKRTNLMLREHGYKTATKSMHIKAKAIDFHIHGYSSKKSYLLAKKINPGGLGFYASQDFVHMDTGLKRFWSVA